MKKFLFSRFDAHLVSTPLPELHLDGVLEDRPGTVRTFADRMESVSPCLMIKELVYVITTPSRSNGDGRAARQKAIITGGDISELLRVKELVETGEAFQPRTEADDRKLRAAMSLVDIPTTAQKKIHLSAATWDSPGQVAELTDPILEARGTISHLSCITYNSGISPGTADFVAEAVIGFASVQEAKHAERLLNRIGYRHVVVTRLYDDLADIGRGTRLVA